MIIWKGIYNLIALPLLVLLAHVMIPFNRKVRRGLRGRRSSLKRVKEYLATLDDPRPSIYWFHVASHGEYEQTRPIIQGLKEISPDNIAILSFFSPSGYEHTSDPLIDFKFYLPIDTKRNMRRLIKAIQPVRVVFASYDIWPNLIWQCRRKQITTVLFAARIVTGSPKHWPLISNFYRHIYGAFTHIFTVTELDHKRVRQILGANSSTDVQHLGNPRYDRVMERNNSGRLKSKNDHHKVMVLGSMHKADHDIIAAPLYGCLQADPELRILWAPHETEPEVIAAIGAELTANGISWERYARRLGRFRDNQVLIIDGIGYLAELYSRSRIAYVGGGFSSGIHNVMEPAIAGIPVIMGPRIQRSDEAEQLCDQGGGFVVESGREFETVLQELLADASKRAAAGRAAMGVIEKNLHASTRILQGIIGR